MGQKSKAQQAAEMRRHQENLRAEALKKQKKQERLVWQIIIGALALVLILVVGSLAITSALDKKAENDRNKQNENAPKIQNRLIYKSNLISFSAFFFVFKRDVF